jgi:hyperosmotically inducible protein
MKTSTLLIVAGLAVSPVLLLAKTEADRDIERTAESSYNFRTVLGDRVRVSADDGVVTLTGTVTDPDQRALAENTVNGQPGVNRVDDRIKVEENNGAKEHSDKWLSFKIHTMLLTRSNVSSKTKVDVRDGYVTLRGEAKNDAQKELTEQYVKEIEGVRGVRNELEIEGTADTGATYRENREEERTPAATESNRRDFGTVVDDTSIAAQVKYELLSHRATSALSTKVDVHDGDIVIRGEAKSDAEKDLVTELAKSVRGARNVTNEMTVVPNDRS